MVIEYIGTIIRNEVANRREKIYEEQVRKIRKYLTWDLIPAFCVLYSIQMYKLFFFFSPPSLICDFYILLLLQNRGIYMFRINNEHVIDATLTGGPAR